MCIYRMLTSESNGQEFGEGNGRGFGVLGLGV